MIINSNAIMGLESPLTLGTHTSQLAVAEVYSGYVREYAQRSEGTQPAVDIRRFREHWLNRDGLSEFLLSFLNMHPSSP